MSVGRVAIGMSLIVKPQLVTGMWIAKGGRTPAGRLLSRALGARDMAIGLGALAGTRAGAPLRGWLAAGLLADATDLVATLVERDDLPRTAVPLVVATAGAGIALGALGLAGAGNSDAPPPPVPA